MKDRPPIRPARFSYGEFIDWLNRNGIDPDNTQSVEFVTSVQAMPHPEYMSPARVYLRVTRYLSDEHRSRFAIWPLFGRKEHAEAATEVVFMPIRDLPAADMPEETT